MNARRIAKIATKCNGKMNKYIEIKKKTPYINGVVGADIKLSLKTRIKILFSKGIQVSFIGQTANNSVWIPVTERLPVEDGFYLATYDGEIYGQDEPFTGLAEFENGKWIDDEEDYQCIIAWMPMPEPYEMEVNADA